MGHTLLELLLNSGYVGRIEWRGRGIDELGIDCSTGGTVVKVEHCRE